MDGRRFARDATITNLIARGVQNPEEEVSKMLSEISSSQIARDIMATGVSKEKAYAEARRQRLDASAPPPALWSFKECILEALTRLNVNAGVGADLLMQTLKEMDRPSTPDHMTAALWSLQKSQLVTFRETKSQHGSQLHRIRLTPNGRDKIKLMRDGVSPTSTLGKLPEAKPHKGRHPVGVDMTKADNHHWIAKAEPATLVHPDGSTEIKAASKSLPRSSPLPQNMKAPLPDVIDETQPGETVLEDHGTAMEADGTSMEVHDKRLDIDLATYPLLSSLVERRAEKAAARDRAAKMVEAASMIADVDPEQAEVLMTRAAEMEGPSLTDLEKEILRLIDAVS